MGTLSENRCFRCKDNCTPAANISADQEGTSFICVGFNRPEDRSLKQDRFTFCWKNSAIDDLSHWDKRDLLDTMSVISQALSIDENIRVNNNFTEEDMQEVNLI